MIEMLLLGLIAAAIALAYGGRRPKGSSDDHPGHAPSGSPGARSGDDGDSGGDSD